MQSIKSENKLVPQVRSIVCNFRKKKTIHGLASDQFKSAIQKYARRGMVKEGIQCVLDAELLFLCPDESESTAKSIKAARTNVMNRICVAAAEDCLHPGIYPEVARLSDIWFNDRDSPAGMSAIVSLYHLVASARKGRLPSIIKLFVAASQLPHSFKEKWTFLKQKPGTFEQLLTRGGDLSCAAYLPTSKDGIAKAWTFMNTLHVSIAAKTVIASLKTMHTRMTKRNHTEAFLYFYQAVALTAYRDRVTDWTTRPQVPDRFLDSNILEVFRAHVLDINPIKLHDFCLDVHTAKGKADGKNALDFAIACSEKGRAVMDDVIVPPEDMKSFTAMYIESKTVINNNKRSLESEPSKPSKIAKTTTKIAVSQSGIPAISLTSANLIPMMKNTCCGKPMTYIYGDLAIKPTDQADPVVFDACKGIFGLQHTHAKLVKSEVEFRLDKVTKVHSIIPTPGSFNTFLVTKIVRGKDNTIAPTIATLKKQDKEPLRNDAIMLQFIYIALVRSLFLVTDFGPSNAVLDASGTVVSIDENSIGASSVVFPHFNTYGKQMMARPNLLQRAINNVHSITSDPKFSDKLECTLMDTKLLTEAECTRIVRLVTERAGNLAVDVKNECDKKIGKK